MGHTNIFMKALLRPVNLLLRPLFSAVAAGRSFMCIERYIFVPASARRNGDQVLDWQTACVICTLVNATGKFYLVCVSTLQLLPTHLCHEIVDHFRIESRWLKFLKMSEDISPRR